MATTKSTHHDVPTHYSPFLAVPPQAAHHHMRQMHKQPTPLGLRSMPPPTHVPWLAPRMMPEPMYLPPPQHPHHYAYPDQMTHVAPLPQREEWSGIGFDMCVNIRPKRRRPEDDPPKQQIKQDIDSSTAPTSTAAPETYADHSPSAASAASTKAPYDSLTSFSEFEEPSFALFVDTPAELSGEHESLWAMEGLPELPPTEPDSYNDEPLLGAPPPFDPMGVQPVLDPVGGDATKVPAVTQGRPLNGDDFTPDNDELSQDAASSYSSSGTRGRSSKYTRKSADSEGSGAISRPALNESHLKELNDLSMFRANEEYKSMIVEYHEGISFALGEGGRELLRACLNVKGCKGRKLQGASVPDLLSLAKEWELWDVAIRIKCERNTGKYCSFHDKFVKFKAHQSAARKTVKKEYMKPERDHNKKLTNIIYDERRKITLGKEGREELRAQLRRHHDKNPTKMDEELQRSGFKYSELRNATVQQLSKMAKVCNQWDKVVHAVRVQEERKESKKGKVIPSEGSSGPQPEETESESSDGPPALEDVDPSQLVADDLHPTDPESDLLSHISHMPDYMDADDSVASTATPHPQVKREQQHSGETEDYHHSSQVVSTGDDFLASDVAYKFPHIADPFQNSTEDEMFQSFMESCNPLGRPTEDVEPSAYHPWVAYDQ